MIKVDQRSLNPLGAPHCIKAVKKESLEDIANKILFQYGLLGRLGITLEEREGVSSFILAGRIEDNREVFQKISTAIKEITQQTDANVLFGLEKRGCNLLFKRPVCVDSTKPVDIAQSILRQYSDLDGLEIILEERAKISSFVLKGKIKDTREAFEELKAVIEQIDEQTNMNVYFGLAKENGFLKL